MLGLATVVVAMVLISCEKKDVGIIKCKVENPTEEIGWLKDAINGMRDEEYGYYVMADNKGETVFYSANCNPAANSITIVRDCSGENLGFTNDMYDQLTNKTIIWKHPNSKCDFH